MLVAIDAVGIRGHGGAAVFCELCRWLPVARPQWRWHVFLLDRSSREFDDPIVSERVTVEHVRVGHSNLKRLLWVNRRLPARLSAIGADVLFSLANLAPTRSRPATVVFCHQANAFLSEPIPSQSRLQRLRIRFMRSQILRAARASQAVIVQTKALRDRILELEPSLNERIHVIPSGYRSPPETPCVCAEKKTLIDHAERPRLIYVSHPSEHKNHVTLLRAMPYILEAFPSASLQLTLERHRAGDSRYNAFVDEILHAAESLGVASRLVWLGVLNPDEVSYALRSSDLMVFPSLIESFGLGLVESMAAGCPIAASDLPYARDVCGEAATYFDPIDPRSIARSVVPVLQDTQELERLRVMGNGRRHLFSYRHIVEQIAQVIDAAARSRAMRQ